MPRYSHKRPPASHTSSIQFDAGVSDRKPTAAKSAGTLGKWGVTSFTSIRSSIVNGSARSGQDSSTDGRVASPPSVPPADPFSFESTTPGAAPVRKVKKFFKSRNAAPSAGAGPGVGVAAARRQLPMARPPPAAPPPPPVDLQNVLSPADEKPEEPESKRFFSSPALPQPLRDTTTNRANSLSPREPPAAPQVPRMPPLKLRISRDKDTGDLTAVSGPPAEGAGVGGRRRRQPAAAAAAAAPQPPKAPRYKSPPAAARAASPDPPADEDGGGGRAVRRTRRAAALEARERVAKTVQSGDDEEEVLLPAARGRRTQRRRSSASDPPAAAAAPEPEPPAAVGSPVANGSSSPATGAEERANSPMAEDEPPPPPPEPLAAGGDADSAPVTPPPPSAPPPPPPPPSPPPPPPPPPARMPVLTPAPTLVQSSPPPPPPVPPAAESATGAPAATLEPGPPAAAAGDQSLEPVNLSTRRPPADLERQLSSLFGEPPPTAAPAPAPAAPPDTEPASRVYRKGIKDLGRYHRTQETQEWTPAPAPAAGGSPRSYQDLESQLELLESGGAPAVSGSCPQETEAPPPPLARANTEPIPACSAAPAPAPAPGKTAATPAEPKKGSIFKTRTGQGRAARARYNHRWTDDKDEPPAAAAAATAAAAAATAAPAQSSDPPSALSALDFTDDPPAGGPGGLPSAGGGGGGGPVSGRLTRVSTWHGSNLNSSQQPVTSVKVDRRAKEYYTVIQNVKKAYQIQEFGEYQEYNDDIDYIMDALQPTNSLSTRCLSATRLAGKCMVPAFRMHLRAHGTVTRFFSALSDAPADPCLSLCTSAVMFILSEDQLNMDLDKSSLELMLSLLDSDSSSSAADSDESNAELRKNRAKVSELCAQLQRQGQAKQLQLDNITAGHLSMETLLSLTSQRAGAWFKEELRELGGLDRLLGTVSESLKSLRHPRQLRHQRDTIARINRCLRVVENVTSRNEENQRYLLRAGGGEALTTLSQLFQLAESELSDCTPAEFQSSGGASRVLLEMADTLMKVLVNLSSLGASSQSSRPPPSTSSSQAGGALLGEQPGLLDALLDAVLRLPERLPEERQFDLLLLAMYLLMNLAESGAENRQRIAAAGAPPRPGQITDVSPAGSAVAELLQMFHRLIRLASEVETHTDRILDGSEPAGPAASGATGPGGSQQDAGEVTATALIQKAGHHMEKTVIAAYIGVLVGHLAINSPEHEAAVRSCLNGGNFTDVIDVLRKLLSFMDLTNTGRPETLHEMRTMRRVIDFMTAADRAGSQSAAPTAAACQDIGVLDMSL